MTAHAKVEAAETVTRKTVSTTLEDDGLRLVVVHYGLNNRLENGLVGIIGNTIAKREIDGVVLSNANSDVAQLASSGEVLSILVEGAGHNSVGCVEGLFNAITVVNVDVDVQDALLVSQELENCEDDV